MRIGGNIPKQYNTVDEWLEIVKDLGYSTVLSPFNQSNPTDATIEAYKECAKMNDIVIGEVGIWNNPLHLDVDERNKAIDYCKERLALAEALGANCSVNIAGARGPIWDGLYEENYSPETYSLLVETIQEIIDAVNPENTFYTLEPMPWMIPDSPEQYLQLIRDVDRKAFGIHLDFANMINSPERYAMRDEFIKKCFTLLGPYIKSVHLKDVKLEPGFPINIQECMVGQGDIDLEAVIRLCEALGPETTVFVEDMSEYEDYKNSVAYIRTLAKKIGVVIK